MKLQVVIFILAIVLFQSGCNQSGNKEQEANYIAHPDFNEHIAPILIKRCAPCHRPGSAGPFSLLTYHDVKKKAKTIKQVLEDGLMPPWPADTSYSRFRDEKIITSQEKELLLTWIKQGARPGDSAKTVKVPSFPEMSLLGKPNLTVKMDTFFIEGNNRDYFMMIKVPYELPADTFISAIEIIPGNKKLTHHIRAKPVNAELHNKSDAYQLLDLANDDKTYPMLTPSVSNYLPGVISSAYPVGIGGYSVKKQGTVLLDNIHYGPSPIDTFDCTTINFFFSPAAPSRPVREMILGTSGIAPVYPPLIIQPNHIDTFTIRYTLAQSISLVTINPHMHLLGKSFLAYAITPLQDTIPLIRVKQWDFRWQYFYTFNKMMPLMAGTTIIVKGVFDNTEKNPLNPFHPPQVVSEREGSMRTTDEMFQFIISYTTYKPGDKNVSLELNTTQ